MADTKTTALTENISPLTTDLLYMIDDPGGSPLSQKITLQNIRAALTPHAACGGRLTLTTGVPVTTADVTGAATLYFTPYSGSQFCGQIGLYDGSAKWDVLDFTELSLSLAGYTASKPYDIWCYNNSGTPTLESTIWTDATTRATALTTQNGIYVKTGATTRRYLGTIYINSSGAQTDDSVTKRNVFNYYNRKLRKTLKVEETLHTYETSAWRAWNNDATVRIEVMIGVVEDPVLVSLTAYAETSLVSIGYDATNTELNAKLRASYINMTVVLTLGGQFSHYPSVGWHWYQAIEYGFTGALQTGAFISADVFA